MTTSVTVETTLWPVLVRRTTKVAGVPDHVDETMIEAGSNCPLYIHPSQSVELIELPPPEA